MSLERALRSGTTVAGEWRIERVLGAGGFGITYDARSRRSGERVALKEYMPLGCCSRVSTSSEITASAGRDGDVFRWGRQRFLREAETLARLDHPSIVRVAGHFEANGTAYMALAYEEGGTLADWLAGLDGLPLQDELDEILRPLLDALTQVHSLYLQHRDIKPDNIMLRRDGAPVLIDFGAVRSAIVGHSHIVGATASGATSAFAIVSHGYSPPEQYDPGGANMGPASDVYALGATLHYALTGTPPPAAPSRIFDDPYVPLARRLAGSVWRTDFLAGVDRALAVNPKARPQSAVEMRRLLGVPRLPETARAASADRSVREPSRVPAEAPRAMDRAAGEAASGTPRAQSEARHEEAPPAAAVPEPREETLGQLVRRRAWQIVLDVLGLALLFGAIAAADGGKSWSTGSKTAALIGVVMMLIGAALFIIEKPPRSGP